MNNIKIIKRKTGCAPCELLTIWMKENNIELPVIYVEDDIEYCKSIGARVAPSLVINDREIIGGLDPIKEYLEKNFLINN